MQSFNYPRPNNWVLFESFCLKLFREHLSLPHLEKFARSGQNQFGLDLVSITSDGATGIQCKLKNTGAGLTKQAVDEAIELAKTFDPPLREFIIATSAGRDPDLQKHALRVSLNHLATGLFTVTIYSWDDIEEVLNQNSELVAELFPALRSTSIIHVAAAINHNVVTGASHAEIDEAARFITEDRPDVALALLEKMRRDRWEGLTPRERFRVIANIGNGLLRKGNVRGAALAFFEAATHQPQDDDAALSIAAHGYLLSGNVAEAYRMASEACARNPMNERGHIIRIQSAPKEIPYGELCATVPEVLRANHNIALVLSERSMEENDPAEAERVLRLVQEKSPALHNALGAALLQQGLPAGAQEGMLLLPSDTDKVREAHAHLTDALDSPDAPAGIIATAHFNRGLASLLLRDENQALADLRFAYEREPNNETFGAALVAEAFRQGENSSALKTAEELFKATATPRSRLLLSMALYDSVTDEARQKALALLQDGLADLEGIEPELRLEYIRGTLHLLSLSGGLTDEAAEALEERLEDPLEKGIIRTLALLRMDRRDEAVEEAQRTAALITEITSFAGKREVALLLSRLELAEQALPLWLKIVPPQTFGEDTVLLLRSAETLGKDDLILDYCEQLRSNGIYAHEAAENEIELLVRYNELRLAQAVMREYLDANPQNISLRLALLNVAVVEGWSEIVDAYTTSLPAPREIKTVADGARLVQILQFKGSARVATELAYELVRRFPDESVSHRALIIAILGIGGPKKDLKLDAPPEVSIGSAVRIRREGEESSQWIVIEDSERPEISRDEYAPDHQLAQALIGRKVGDTITLPKLLVRTQTAVIEEIKNKILFRMHQSMEQMNRRFPESSFFESVSIGITDESSPPTGHELDELIDLNRALAQGPMQAEKLYRERRMPVSMLAALVGREVPEIVEYLATNEREVIHCVGGAAEEFSTCQHCVRPCASGGLRHCRAQYNRLIR